MAEKNDNILVSAAKAIGTVAGKVAAVAGTKPEVRVKENLYSAEYLGSGTFIISKPKRKSAKRRQSALKGTVRGARK